MEGINLANMDIPASGTHDSLSENKGESSQTPHLGESTKQYRKPEDAPTVDPLVGMVFRSDDDAYNFYNIYSLRRGFAVRKDTVTYSAKDGSYLRRTFLCNHAAYSHGKRKQECLSNDRKKNTSSIVSHCKARMKLRCKGPDIFEIYKFMDEHNHEMADTPAKGKFNHSHKQIRGRVMKSLLQSFTASNLSSGQQMKIFATSDGTYSDPLFSRRDVTNQRAIIKANERVDDMAKTISYFEKKKLEDRNFFYAIQLDESNMVKGIFWTHGRSRLAYASYGDCITFDTTFKTNRYNMPFALFVGVNNHFQSTIFGGALLCNETKEVFKWLFETFLRTMGGKEPEGILTDQDQAMKSAIAEVFKTAKHRFCRWHILKKCKEKLGAVYHNSPNFKRDMQICIDQSHTPTEFEDAWNVFVSSYNLSNNEYIQHLWDMRSSWIPVYFRDVFFAKMTTTQRSESMNRMLKRYLDSSTSMITFVKEYDYIVQLRIDAERSEDFQTLQKMHTLRTYFPIERHAASIYTRTILHNFVEELLLSTSYMATPSANGTQYVLKHLNPNCTIPRQRPSCIVNVDNACGSFDCECKYFEQTKLLCSHVLKVMTQLGVMEIPEKYVAHRWTKYANSNYNHEKQPLVSPYSCGQQKQLWQAVLYRNVMKLIDISCRSEETFRRVNGIIKDLIDEHQGCQVGDDHIRSHGVDTCNGESVSTEKDGDVEQLLPHLQRVEKTKGRPSNKRFKSSLEKCKTRQNKCSVCKVAGHNSATCSAKASQQGMTDRRPIPETPTTDPRNQCSM